jgi:hypothetical protein
MAAKKSLYLSLQSQLVECVILLGKDLMKMLSAKFDYERDALDLPRLGVRDARLSEHPRHGHYMQDILPEPGRMYNDRVVMTTVTSTAMPTAMTVAPPGKRRKAGKIQSA